MADEGMDVGISQFDFFPQFSWPGIRAVMPVEMTARILGDGASLPEREGRKHPEEEETGGLTPEERKQVEALKRRDREVREHEQAHKTAGRGLLIQGPFFTYEFGPDKKRYAVSGEVTIDASGIPDDPEATISKMQKVRHAALAPREPSSKDRQVASKASSTESKARIELAAMELERDRLAREPAESIRATRGAAGEAYQDSVQDPGEGLLLSLTA